VGISALGWDAIQTEGQVILAEASAAHRYWEIDWRRPSTLIVSNEATGASEPARRLATERVAIPMHAQIESLNAGIAGSIILYEALRQRTTTGVSA
jgi:TrmH family RNA methyltransferase